MPDITAWADAFRDWDALIGQLNENGDLVPGHEAQKADLLAIFERARLLKVQQESLKGNAVAATDSFLDAVDEGRDKARKLRSFIVSVLGPRNPKLKLFGIPPKPLPNPNNRSGRRRAKKSANPPQTPTPEAPTNAPPVAAKSAEPAAGKEES
jgi:hypothetical protein